MPYAILIAFFLGIIFTCFRRVKHSDYGFSARESTVGGAAFASGFIVGLLLAILVAIAPSGTNDPGANYYINGVVFKDGTDWMVVMSTFVFGGGIVGVIIQFVSALPARLVHSMKKGRCQDRDKKAM